MVAYNLLRYRILVCVPSNQAADLIAERLVRSGIYVPGDFVRLNGFLRSGHQVPDLIMDFCSDGENLNAVLRHRVVISTISTAGQFFQLRLTPDHFTHVFIDEASYATEPEALVSCVLSAVGKEGQVMEKLCKTVMIIFILYSKFKRDFFQIRCRSFWLVIQISYFQYYITGLKFTKSSADRSLSG